MDNPWMPLRGKVLLARVKLCAAGMILAAVLIVVEGMQRVAHADDHREVCPSKVLVLYNADWQESHPLVGAKQDSLAVAEHYVDMRRNPASGEQPYLFGLSCGGDADSPLNTDHLREISSDNNCGVVYQPPGAQKPLSACGMRDSRLVEVVLPPSEVPWEMLSLELELHPDPAIGTSPIILVQDGVSRFPGAVEVHHGEEWQVRANGRTFLHGRFTAVARCEDVTGHEHEWRVEYHDVQFVAFSPTGPDGARDDQNYLNCVEGPVKAYLADPDNARPDGILLKDHILYIVVAYGLPKTVAAPYGIAPGITERLNNYGPGIDFGQRLQLMYYDLEELHRNQVRPKRFTASRGDAAAFGNYLFRTTLAEPLWGEDTNPFVHPKVYLREDRKLERRPPRFTASQRAFRPDRHLFFSMRIDGENALEAMELTSRSVYASRFASPKMGVLPGVSLAASPERTGDMSRDPGKLFWDAGYRHLFRESWGRGRVRIALFRLAPDMGFFNTDEVFLPGGIATQVLSRSSWNRTDSPLHKYLRQGVTVTAGAARSGRGAPHIHNHSFWDEEIFNSLLLEGYPVGELLLMNQIHMGWITSFVGDPLYRLPPDPPRPSAPPSLSWEHNVQVSSVHNPEHGNGVLVMLDLEATPEEPRVAQMRLARADKATLGQWEHVFERFASRPYVYIPEGPGSAGDEWIMEVIDPFGKMAELRGRLEEEAIAEPDVPTQ